MVLSLRATTLKKIVDEIARHILRLLWPPISGRSTAAHFLKKVFDERLKIRRKTKRGIRLFDSLFRVPHAPV